MIRLGYGVAAFLLAFVLLAPQSKAQEPVPFHGLYGGFYSGYVAVDEEYTDVLGPRNYELDGWINGLTAGYNHRHDRILVGVEVDGGILEVHDREAGCGVVPTCEIDISWLVTARGRLGYIFGDQEHYALYFTGGFAAVGYDVTVAGGGVKEKFHDSGFVVGGGGEAYLFGTNWLSTKIEYLYIGFTGGANSFTQNSVDTATIELDAMHIVRAGLNIHF
jgi:outer membrane immunogenic protein